MILLTVFFLFDLGRADVPWVIHWDYKQKYEVGTLNPIVDFLRNEPYEHRVAEMPFELPGDMFALYHQLYRVEWMQHHFPYYNIQCLDIIQMPRMAEDLSQYLTAILPHSQSQSEFWRFSRHWQLTNTRYLLGPAVNVDEVNSSYRPDAPQFPRCQTFRYRA